MGAAGYRQAVAPGAVAAVVGCGAMGRGIAQLLAQAGLHVRLFDTVAGAADEAREAIGVDLDRLVGRRKVTAVESVAVKTRLQPVTALAELEDATLVVEAVVEDLETKRRLFGELEPLLPGHAILATNTSSLSVTAIAAACARPERVAGFHFFNPAPVMKVVEVVAALRTEAAICDALAELAERFGHAAVRTLDTPGFVVNHAGRGYGTEGLKILAEGICSPSVLDVVLRDACGFKLGPCELLDLTGLDVSHPVMESIYHQYYEEPRFRPQVLTRRMQEGGLLGRKRGHGFYRYVDGSQERPPTAARPSAAPPRVWINPTTAERADGIRPAGDSLIVVTPLGLDATGMIVADGLDAGRTIAFDALFPGRAVRCLFASPGLEESWRESACAAFFTEGVDVYLVRDSVGLIAQRVLAHVVNVACAIAEQRIASPLDIDRAVKLGLGYPMGPLVWGDAIGASNLRRILDGLIASTGDPRYRATAWLGRRAALGLSLTHAD